MVAKIFKCVVILLIAIAFLVYWGIRAVLGGLPGTGGGYSVNKHSSTRNSTWSYTLKDPQQIERENLQKMNQLQVNVEFICKYEDKPALSPETQLIYNYTLYHDLHNIRSAPKDAPIWEDLARYYRIAAMNGDYEANIRLQYLIKSERIPSDIVKSERYRLNQVLAKQLPATAYYKTFGILDVGYGKKTTKDGMYGYLRKSADWGSRDAQYEASEILEEINDQKTLQIRSNVINKLRTCAAEQGLGKALNFVGIHLQSKRNYEEAIKVFQQGIKNGNATSARYLANAFNGLQKENSRYFLNLSEDLERTRRYKIIGDYLYYKDYLQPKVPDLDDIVPLPPAPLPKWDGKIAFQRWFEGEAPPKPDEALVRRLAWQAGLNGDTGLDEKTGMPKKPTK